MYLQTLKDMTYSLSFISVLLCTQSVYFVWAVVLAVAPWQTSIVVYFQNQQSVSTGHTGRGINKFKRHVHNFSIRSFCVIL